MYELHQNEQYFFDPPTLNHLSHFVGAWPRVCCLCTPLLGKQLAAQGARVTVLDIDERFAAVPGFRRYDIYRPARLEAEFDLIVCDPPFFNVSLSQLFNAVRVLSHYRFDQPLLVAYLQRRAPAILGTFTLFGLRPTGFLPKYQTVQASERNQVEFFSNLADEHIQKLCEGWGQ